MPSQSWPRNYTGVVTGTGIPSEQGPDVSRIAARALHGPANDRLAALGAEGERVGRRGNDDDRRGLAAGDAERQGARARHRPVRGRLATALERYWGLEAPRPPPRSALRHTPA